MARKNRLAASFLAYSVFGLIIGAALGFALDAVFARQANSSFAGYVTLYRIPTQGSDQAARDFISTALARKGYLEGFTDKHGLDSKTQSLLAKGLTVVARDASSPSADLKLVGKDPTLLTTTLDALAIHITETLRSIEEPELQGLLDKLNNEIETVNKPYLELLGSRFEHKKLPTAAADEVRKAAALISKKHEMELTQRYTFKPQSPQQELFLQQDLDALSKELHRQTEQAAKHFNTDSQDYKFASSLAYLEATVRALRQTKQRLVIAFNQGTPLRVTGRAVVEPLFISSPPTVVVVGVCALIGGLLGAVGCSLQQARYAKITGPSIEKRLGTQVLGVIPKSLTEFGEREMHPMADIEPLSIPLSAIRSFSVAQHLLFPQQSKTVPVIFTAIGKGQDAGHFIANLAVTMAHRGERILLVDANNTHSLDMFRSDSKFASTTTLQIKELKDDGGSQPHIDKGSISFKVAVADKKATSNLLTETSHFDRILILVGDANKAKHMLEGYGCGIGLVVCDDKTRMSKIRKALGKASHGVVLCGYDIRESVYGGELKKVS